MAPTDMFGTDNAASAAQASRRALSQIETASPKDAAAWPAASDPTTNAADPPPRTQPYSNPLPVVGSEADSAIASAVGASAARKPDCITPTSRIGTKVSAGRYATSITSTTHPQNDK